MSRVVILIASFSTLAIASPTSAMSTVETGNISLSESNEFSDYGLTVFQDAAATDFTSVYFDYDGNNLEIISWNIDEESDWYLVASGDEFSAQNIDGGVFTTIFTADSPRGPIAVGSGDFFLGVNTGLGFDAPLFEPNRDVFGWVHLRNTGTELVLLGDAMAYDFPTPGAPENGIIVGAVDAIPEPSALMLFVVGFAIVSPVRRGADGDSAG